MRLTPHGEIFLTKAHSGEKKIGVISSENGTVTYRKNENEKDIIRKYNAWSINTVVLSLCDRVEYITENAIYRIDQRKAFQKGMVFNKYSKGLDDKLVVPLSHWTKTYKDKSKETATKLFGESWGSLLQPVIQEPYFKNISVQIKKDRAITGVNPSSENVFRAFHLTPFEELKVILLGKEPDAHKASDGLAYSGTDYLDLFFDVIESEVYSGFMLDKDPNLEKWAEKGVLLLNKSLTVPFSVEDGHDDLWSDFTDFVLKAICHKNSNVIFFTWENIISEYVNEFLTKNNFANEHISNPLINQNSFSKINTLIKEKGYSSINW